eukprot:SAG22_NODE_470_length_10142_cov_13.947227_5_plen_188_part_00
MNPPGFVNGRLLRSYVPGSRWPLKLSASSDSKEAKHGRAQLECAPPDTRARHVPRPQVHVLPCGLIALRGCRRPHTPPPAPPSSSTDGGGYAPRECTCAAAAVPSGRSTVARPHSARCEPALRLGSGGGGGGGGDDAAAKRGHHRARRPREDHAGRPAAAELRRARRRPSGADQGRRPDGRLHGPGE